MRRPLFALFCLFAVLLHAPQAGAAQSAERDRYRISALTFGPGDHVFLKFGHNAVLVEDRVTGRADVYNFGTFEFGSPTLISDFMQGRLLYWLSVQSMRATLRHYSSANRSVRAQELRLTPELEARFVQALEVNALPENRAYKYDYYLDNCSTRVRDALDDLLEGRVRTASRDPASMTFRAHTLRLTQDALFVTLGLDIAMGAFIDRPITRWEEMFIPEKLEEVLRDVTVETDAGELPLVVGESVLFEAARPASSSARPEWTLRMGLVGLALGALLFASARVGKKVRLGASSYFVLLAVAGLVLGALGNIFAFFWLFTDHRVAYANENLLQCPPFALLLAVTAWPLAYRAARGRDLLADTRSARLTRRLVMACAVASVTGLLVKALPWFRQENAEFIALLLPFWLGSALGAHVLLRSRRASV